MPEVSNNRGGYPCPIMPIVEPLPQPHQCYIHGNFGAAWHCGIGFYKDRNARRAHHLITTDNKKAVQALNSVCMQADKMVSQTVLSGAQSSPRTSMGGLCMFSSLLPTPEMCVCTAGERSQLKVEVASGVGLGWVCTVLDRPALGATPRPYSRCPVAGLQNAPKWRFRHAPA